VRRSTVPPPPNKKRKARGDATGGIGTGGGAASSPRPSRPSRPPRPPSALALRVRGLARRAGAIAVRVVVAAGIAAALVALGLFLHHYVTSSQHFEVRDIKLEGAERVGRDEILSAGRIAAGANVFEIDPAQAAARIRALPWIRSATVRRRLPGEVTVKVEERTAGAIIELEGLYLVDAEGVIFKRLGENDPDDLPILTGLTRQAVLEHPEGAREAIQEALGLLAEYRDTGLDARAPASEVHRDGSTGWTIVLADDGTRVRLGSGPYRVKLGRLGRLLQELAKKRMRAEYIYLDNRVRQDRATVKLRPADPPEPPGGQG
jgi:cell division protein FtsQ